VGHRGRRGAKHPSANAGSNPVSSAQLEPTLTGLITGMSALLMVRNSAVWNIRLCSNAINLPASVVETHRRGPPHTQNEDVQFGAKRDGQCSQGAPDLRPLKQYPPDNRDPHTRPHSPYLRSTPAMWSEPWHFRESRCRMHGMQSLSITDTSSSSPEERKRWVAWHTMTTLQCKLSRGKEVIDS
jgi:hypothetical protein